MKKIKKDVYNFSTRKAEKHPGTYQSVSLTYLVSLNLVRCYLNNNNDKIKVGSTQGMMAEVVIWPSCACAPVHTHIQLPAHT